ncbi:universal stress protein [Algoriphagus halophytocola]|uniref:universal stress protein n=1 Tax=Algoriphagus halophytocola TaxID=2991499 RepID=UPI0022DD58B7|nr:universal stress protein [Algoriphagus sp. TR-M9]WBL44547.1 universal stress protein [Algoriphagus sp. TR-M9]
MKVVVALDFSDISLNALDFAVALAEKKDGEIILVHVIEAVFDFASQASVALESMHADAEKLMKKSIVGRKNTGLKFRSVIKEGTASISISKLATEVGATLIVMGTQGSSGILKSLMGSTTINLIKEATVPTLVVPAESDPSFIQKVAIAMEFADDETDFIEWVIGLSKRWESGLEFVHVQTGLENNVDQKISELVKFMETNYPKTPTKIHKFYAKTAVEGLDQYLEENENVVLVMSHHHKNVWDQILSRSQTMKMIFHSKVPILVMP